IGGERGGLGGGKPRFMRRRASPRGGNCNWRWRARWNWLAILEQTYGLRDHFKFRAAEQTQRSRFWNWLAVYPLQHTQGARLNLGVRVLEQIKIEGGATSRFVER